MKCSAIYRPFVPITSVRCCGRFRSSRRAKTCRRTAIRGRTHPNRRRRDQKDHRQAGGDRTSFDHGRRITAGLLAFRFPRRVDGVEMAEAEGIKFAGVHVQGRGAAREGQARLRATIRMIAHFEFLKANTKRHAQDDDPQPVDACIIAAGRKMIDRALSEHGMSSIAISARPTNRRSRASTRPAAVTCSSTIAASPTCAIRPSAPCWPSAATIPTGRPRSISA